MAYNLSVDGRQTECEIQDNKVIFGGTTSTTVDVIDIINIEEAENGSFKLHVINKSKNPKWSRSSKKITGDSNVCNTFLCEIKDLMKQVPPKPRKFLVMINPVGGKQSGEKSYKNIVAPVFSLAGITTEVIVSERPKHVVDVMTSYDFSGTDGIVLCGGDGTYHECVATLLRRFQNEAGIDLNDINAPIKSLPFPVAMIPTGTGNVIAATNYGTDDIETAALHIVRGEMKKRCVCSFYEYGRFLTYAGQSFSYGFFTEMLYKMNTTRSLKGKMRLLIPLHFFLFKRHRQFQVEIEYTNKSQQKESNIEQSTANEDVEIKEKTETIRGNYIALVSFIDDMMDDDFRSHGSLRDSNCTSMILYKPCGRLELMSHMKGLATKSPDAISSFIDDLSDEDFRFNNHLRNTFSTTMMMYKPCGRLELMTHFKRLMQRSPDAFQCNFLHNVKFTGFKVKLFEDREGQDSNTDGQKRYIAVDGEIVEISGTEFECKWHKDIVPVYSSY